MILSRLINVSFEIFVNIMYQRGRKEIKRGEGGRGGEVS